MAKESVDLTTLSGYSGLSYNSHSIGVKAHASGYRSSDLSSTVSYTKSYPKLTTPSISVSNGYLTITNHSSFPSGTSFQIWRTGGVVLGSFTGASKNLADYGLSAGTYTLKVYANATGYSQSSVSNSASYTVAEQSTTTISIDVGGTFSHEYSGNSPDVSVSPSGIVSYYDDGGIIEFEGVSAGSCTVTVSEGYLGDGEYETVTTYNVTVNAVSNDGVISGAVIGREYSIYDAYPNDNFETECRYEAYCDDSDILTVTDYDDADIRFVVVGYGTTDIVSSEYDDLDEERSMSYEITIKP